MVEIEKIRTEKHMATNSPYLSDMLLQIDIDTAFVTDFLQSNRELWGGENSLEGCVVLNIGISSATTLNIKQSLIGLKGVLLL